MARAKLVWEPEYSVEVEEIDNQHKKLFVVINELIDVLDMNITDADLSKIIGELIEYKINHFATEEKYFKEFNYEGTIDHVAKHKIFNDKVEELQNKFKGDTLGFAFALVDFLEDWLISHLMTTDQQYKKCFKEHGLK